MAGRQRGAGGKHPGVQGKREIDRRLRTDLEVAVDDFMLAWKPPYSELKDLSAEQREALFGVIMDQLGVRMAKRDFDYLTDKEDLTLADIASALHVARTGQAPAFSPAEDAAPARPQAPED